MRVDGAREERVHGEREGVGGDGMTGSQDWNPRQLHMYTA